MKAFVRDVLGDGGDEVTGIEDLEVAPDLRVHAGTVDDGVALLIDLHLIDRERVSDALPEVPAPGAQPQALQSVYCKFSVGSKTFLTRT